jgi:hypothetical protein
MFVLGVALALGIIVAGLFSFLADSVSSGKQAQEELQQLYGCDGALRLAIDEVRRSGNVDISKVKENLRVLSAALKSDINPRTGRPFADHLEIRADEDATTVGQVGSDPFFGMQFVRQGSRFEVTANPLASRGRVCRAQSPNRLRTISYFEFARVSLDTLGGASTTATAGSSGDIYTLEHTQPLRRFFTGGGRRGRLPTGDVTVNAIRIADNETFRPVPPSGQPWSFINKKKKFFGGTKRRTRHKKPIVEYFVKWPTNTPSVDPTLSRFAMQADIRILDGVWYLDDTNFPGACVWSDRPSGRAGVCTKDRKTSTKLQYSAYETPTSGGALIKDKAAGGAAIISYGVGGGSGPRRPMVDGVCGGDIGFVENHPDDGRPVYRCGATFQETNTLGVDPGDKVDPFLAAAGVGFFDPYLGDDNQKTPILPIVLNVEALGAALNTSVGNGDIGDFRCATIDDVLCPKSQRFKGSIWVGTLPNSIVPGGGGSPNVPGVAQALPNGSRIIPCPLTPDPGAGCVRPNALVIVNAENLDAFVSTGLSIGSNLPIYVVGGINNQTDPAKRTSRIAVLGPVITALSTDFDFEDISFLEPRSNTPGGSTETLDWHASLFTSWSRDGALLTDARDPTRDVLRKLQPGLKVDVTGSMVMMFRRGDYDKIQKFNTRNGSFSSPSLDPLVAGIPTFEFNTRNRLGELDRMASGRVEFPGTAGLDLRRAEFELQPPGAPRFSIDPAPVDRR